MRARLVAIALVSAVGVPALGCGWLIEPKPDVDNPKAFELDGLSLSYPGNWSVSQESEAVENVTITTATFESTGNAMLIVQQFAPSVPLDMSELATEYASTIQSSASTEMGGIATVNVGASTEISREILGASRNGRQTHMSISVLGESVPHTLDVLGAELEDRTVVFISQVADEDRAKSLPAFELIMDSAKFEGPPALEGS